jgi:hypothetical protein
MDIALVAVLAGFVGAGTSGFFLLRQSREELKAARRRERVDYLRGQMEEFIRLRTEIRSNYDDNDERMSRAHSAATKKIKFEVSYPEWAEVYARMLVLPSEIDVQYQLDVLKKREGHLFDDAIPTRSNVRMLDDVIIGLGELISKEMGV